MNKPTFSILSPTYNCANFILRSYHSLCSQTRDDWEWVIVDDGSNDNTQEIVKTLNDSRVKFHTYAVNKGRGFARNYGLTKCLGEIVVVWDIDDIYLPNRLENIYNEIIVDQYDFMVSKAIVVDNSFNVKGIRGFSDSTLFRGFVHPTLAFKSSIKEVVNYDKKMRAGEDLSLMIELSNNYRGKYLDENLMLYFEDREVNLQKTIQMHESHTETIRKVIKERTVTVSKSDYLKINFLLFAKNMILKAFLLKPSLYLKTVKFRKKGIAENEVNEVQKMVQEIKIQYSKFQV